MKPNQYFFKKILLIAFISIVSISYSQDYYFPLNIQRAYENGTRSFDGKPGRNYWQNKADYKIDVDLKTETDEILGKEEITYQNNSPDSLRTIVFRLYQDFFKKGNARQFPVAEADLMDGVKITKLIIGGEEYDPEKAGGWWQMTNLLIRLEKPIPPGQSMKVEVEWNFPLPTERGLRMRKYNDGHYFVAYWYPQIAVYDDVDGWDMVEYLGSVEFYNDINNFDVNITVPGDYLVWATGELQNAEELLQFDVLGRYKSARESDEVIQIIKQQDYKDKKVTVKGKTHTWHFKADDVPDISFGASDHSNWDGCSLIVDSVSGRRVFTDVVYPDGSDHWEKAAEVAQKSVRYMSFELPGFPFPYPHVTSFCNGTPRGGMETPMMANDGIPKEFSSLVGLIFHEISHCYFPFFMGTNERKYAFMDEGWAAFLPGDVIEEYKPGSDYFSRQVRGYAHMAGQEVELPLMVPTFQHNDWSSSRTAAYTRPAVAYQMLRETLGDDLFKKALHEYMNRWKGKHPIPYDFFYTFEEVTDQDLYWFFNPWFFQSGYPDLGIVELTSTNELIIEKKGQFPIPVDITWWTDEDESGNKYLSPEIWKDGQAKIGIQLPTDINIVKIELGNTHIPDVDEGDNVLIMD
jgi:hypothetical protein